MIRGSCGHVFTDDDGEDGMGNSVAVKSYSREGTPAVDYRQDCNACVAQHERDGTLLKTDEEQRAWLCSE